MSILILGYFFSAKAQIPHYDQHIPKPLLQKDFLILRDTLEKNHPGLYRYRSKVIMDQIFDSCYASIRDSETDLEFFTRVAYIIAAIGDGHTNANPPKTVFAEWTDKGKFFPALVVFIHNRAYIYCNNQDTALRGTELLSINGVTMQKIIRRTYDYVQSDGFITSHKDTELPEGFNYYYQLLFGVSDKYTITYRTIKEKVGTSTLNSAPFKEILCASPYNRPGKYLELHYEKGSTAVLTIRSFFDGFLQQTKENFHSFLDSAFTDIRQKNVKKLIIDIRRNQGGNDNNGELLYSYLTDRPFRYYLSQETIKEKFSEKDHPNLQIQQPQKNNYSGKLFVLADGRSFSASAEFSSIVKTNRRGLFIGDVVGGGYYGNVSGDEIHVILPATGIDIRLPLVKYTMAVKPLAKNLVSIEPDFPLYPSIEDLIEKRDRELEQAIKIVEVNKD